MKHSIGLKQSLEGRLIVFTSIFFSVLENCTQPTLEPAHVHESKWQRNISRSEMKCAWVDRFFPAFSVKHTEYILVFILTLWGCHLMQSCAGAFLLNTCDLKRFSTTSEELVHSYRVLNKREVMSNRGDFCSTALREHCGFHIRPKSYSCISEERLLLLLEEKSTGMKSL